MGSVVILVGVGDYSSFVDGEKLPPIPQVDRNLEELAPLLLKSLGDDETFELVTIRNPQNTDEMASQIAAAVSRATDSLVFYYCGHGVISSTGDLILTHARTSRSLAEFQALDFGRVRTLLRQSAASQKILILDCCYSGAALSQTLGREDIRAQVSVSGSYAMVSSPATRPSHILPGEEMTAFTARLVEGLGSNTSKEPRLWSLNDLFQFVRARMREDGLPEPQALDANDMGSRRIIKLHPTEGRGRGSSRTCGIREHLDVAKSGVVAFFPDLNEEDNRRIASRMRSAKQIFFCAHTGYNAMVSQYQAAIRDAVSGGAQLRVAITDPESALMAQESLTYRLCPSIRQREEIYDVIRACSRHQAAIGALSISPSNVQVGLYSGVPSMNILRIDGWLRVISYLPLLDAAESPVIEFQFDQHDVPSVVSKYLKSLDALWADCRPADLSIYSREDRRGEIGPSGW